MSAARAYEEVIDLIAAGPTPSALLDFHPSEEAKRRVSKLIEQEKDGTITAEEKSELDHYMQLEHIMRLVKIRARRHLRNE